jgi:HAD superfamily hydrolase (TIGR01450 family)
MTTPQRLPLTTVLDRHAGVLLDAYGVLVNLDGALPGAPELIRRLNRAGQPYLVVSNTAARLPEHAAKRYQAFGLDLAAERILTSGLLLAGYFQLHGLTGRRCLVLGPEDSLAYVTRAGGLAVDWREDFDVLVLADQAGFPFMAAMDGVLSRLFEKMDAGLEVPLLLPNPDLIYPSGQGYGFTAGAAALMLEAALRQRYPQRPGLGFTRLGKPHGGLFESAAGRLGTRDLVMIGDQLETDIRGANAFGIASALVTGGVSLTDRAWDEADDTPVPTYLLNGLSDRET